MSQDQTTKATTAQEAAETPFFGIGGTYSCEKDPFEMCNINKESPVRDYRRRYYAEAAKYFEKGGCQYSAVKRAFIWGTGSWDVLNIYWGDDDDQGRGWTDPVVIDTIQRHNALAQGVPYRASSA